MKRLTPFLVPLLAFGACAANDEPSDSGPTQNDIDTRLAVAFVFGVNTLRDQIVVGAPFGQIDDSRDCPLGGTVALNGTLGGTQENQNQEAVIQMTDCGFSTASPSAVLLVDAAELRANSSITYVDVVNEPLDGTVSYSGDIAVEGEVTVGGVDYDVDQPNCTVGLTYTWDQSNSYAAISGRWCGEIVSDTW